MAASSDPASQRLERLRQYRNRREADLGLGFLQKQFKRDVERPFKQLGNLAESWQALVPAALVERTRLEGLSGGVLRVAVDGSASLYELDRLLRSGLRQQLAANHPRAKLRRIQLRVAPIEQERT